MFIKSYWFGAFSLDLLFINLAVMLNKGFKSLWCYYDIGIDTLDMDFEN